MKLTNIRAVGRYKNPRLGRPVNVRIGFNPDRGTDHLFYLRAGTRVYISDREFYDKDSGWIKA